VRRGSFTWREDMRRWVWTTFNSFQWDLNYANPAVFAEMLDVLVFLAGQGVQGFRLDSAPYLWKAKGTTCRNLPQAYAIVEAWRAALSIIAPSVVLVAEAIESLTDVLPFFGGDGPGCDLAYNNVVMTALWGALADQDAAVVRRCLATALDKPSRAAWLNYVRCHDDVIWNALADYAPHEDLRRWSDFYGRGEGFSRGQAFQTASGGVPSTNGMAACLVGLAPDEGPEAPGAARLRLLYGILHALDGWPLIYMGDEVALGDDVHYRDDPLRAGDGRWLHRPRMDWDRARGRHDADSLPGATFVDFQRLGRAARDLAVQGVSGPSVPVDLGAAPVLAFSRVEGAPFLCVANLSDHVIKADLPEPFAGACTDLLSGKVRSGATIELPSYGLVWLKAAR